MTKHIAIERQGPLGLVTLNRPDRHNAFDDALIAELTEALRSMEAEDGIRAVVLSSVGRSFSAGADLNWMQRASSYGEAENLADARIFAGMLQALSGMSKPTIARIQGAALGGGTGLAAACDMAVAADNAVFSTSEVKFGIIPAVISPYVLRAIGPRHALRYFQSAERIEAEQARMIGLVNEVYPLDQLDAGIASIVESLLAGGPKAQQAAKQLIAAVADKPIDAAVAEETATRIARQRATDEARDGISAFLEKRPPAWLA